MSPASIFSGSSRYSRDFQSVIERSVAIASLPLRQLESQRTSLQTQQQALRELDERFASLSSSVTGLSRAATSDSLAVQSSAPLIVDAATTTGALPGSYQVEVVRTGRVTTAMSSSNLPAVTDPAAQSITSATALQLTVGDQSFTVNPAGSSLNALMQAVNETTATSGVRASIVNLGGSTPSYRLVLQGTRRASETIALSDGQPLLTTVTSGETAQYRLNGIANLVESDREEVLIAPGVSATLRATGQASITVGRSAAALTGAATGFVAAFNNAVAAIDKHRGQAGGGLTGQSLIGQLSQTLRRLAEGSVASGGMSLEEWGFSFTREGNLQVDGERLARQSATDREQARAFFQAFTTQASQALDAVRQPESGLLTGSLTRLQEDLRRQDDQIADVQRRIDLTRESLTARINAADAMIASLEQQVVAVTGLVQARFGRSQS